MAATMRRAHSSSGNLPTPVPKAGSASDSQPSSSASCRHARVVCSTRSPLVRRSWLITAPWITHRAASRPAPVATAEPIGIGPFKSASRSISSPPARLIAPATPPPIQRQSFAAFAIASTSSAVISPSTTAISMAARIDRPPIFTLLSQSCCVAAMVVRLPFSFSPGWVGDGDGYNVGYGRTRARRPATQPNRAARLERIVVAPPLRHLVGVDHVLRHRPEYLALAKEVALRRHDEVRCAPVARDGEPANDGRRDPVHLAHRELGRAGDLVRDRDLRRVQLVAGGVS